MASPVPGDGQGGLGAGRAIGHRTTRSRLARRHWTGQRGALAGGRCSPGAGWLGTGEQRGCASAPAARHDSAPGGLPGPGVRRGLAPLPRHQLGRRSSDCRLGQRPPVDGHCGAHRTARRRGSADCRGRRQGAGPRPGYRAGPGPRQHAERRQGPGVARRHRCPTGRPRARSAGHRAQRALVDRARLRGSAGGRRRFGPAPAVARAGLGSARRQPSRGTPGVGRQGHHLRHRRNLDQAG